ncbi:MAG TPA: glycogen synthase, partial [Longimicrobiales bacterium]|nr:glycogen synthase [Longimicrobiales bacterium]
MKILFVAAEALPWFKTGGLADVARALPDALVERGHDVRIVMPGYSFLAPSINEGTVDAEFNVGWPGGPRPVRVALSADGPGAPTAFVLSPGLFDTDRPYDDVPGDPLALGRRFAFFSRAVARYANHWGADVVHLNDWQAALVPLYGLIDGLDAATLFSIHNLAYQGNFPPVLLPEIGVPGAFHRTENGLEFHGVASFMKGGISLADRLATVSPTYAAEIQTAAYGNGLEGLLAFRRRTLHGVVNGIDTAAWNPATDAFLPETYGVKTLPRKENVRSALLEAAGISGAGAVLGIVTRLAQQKGLEVVLGAAHGLMERGCSLVVLGSGEAHLERGFEAFARAYPGRVAIYRGFNDPLAHLIYGGADFFLMPSLYEPCGLGQMIAQRFGTPPIARRTGGLNDTIEDGATGFLFDAPRPDAFLEAVDRALAVWRRRGWRALQQRCMREDHSWERSAGEYERLYALTM